LEGGIAVAYHRLETAAGRLQFPDSLRREEPSRSLPDGCGNGITKRLNIASDRQVQPPNRSDRRRAVLSLARNVGSPAGCGALGG
jgi:hypothetical protein